MAKTNKDFVAGLYLLLADRVGDSLTIDLLASRLDSGILTRAGLTYDFFTNNQYSISAEKLVRLYFAAFNRIPDYDGLLFWQGIHRNGGTDNFIAQTFTQSDEFVKKYGPSISNGEFIDLLYKNVLSRDADADGKNFWLARMNEGVSRGEMLNAFAQAPEYSKNMAIKVNAILTYFALLGRSPSAAEITQLPVNLEAMVVKVAVGSDVAPVMGAITYSSNVLKENISNDGSILNQLYLYLNGDSFVGNVGASLGKISNVPAGLVASLTKFSDTVAILTLNGNATAHAGSNSISNLSITFDDKSFVGGKAANISNAVKSDIQVSFIDIPFSETKQLLTGKGGLSGALSIDLTLDKLSLDAKSQDLIQGSMTNVINIDLSGITTATSTGTGASTTSKASVTIKADDANNTVILPGIASTVEGGKGDDVITLGSAIDTLIFAATAAANGLDTINGYTIGKGGDVLNFSAFLNKTGTTKIAATLATSITPKAWANGDVLTVQGNNLDAAKLAALFGTAKAFALPTAASKMVIISADIVGDASIWYVVNQNDVAAITADEITLVGVLKNINNLSLLGFDTTNFA